ncbi:hypothetical protein [Pedobacter sp. P26]|uniref:hypothetical protein n=1 Tax=Pedobacter sp. P26 TaxID=3423956 RepID=UPI003D67CF4E
MIKAANDKGLPIAFRFVADGQDQGLNTPQFVIDAGARYYLADSKFPDRKSPIHRIRFFSNTMPNLFRRWPKILTIRSVHRLLMVMDLGNGVRGMV